jgi:hypothetical protein
VGCAANSRRTARARSRRFRTHRVALPARPAAETVTDLAHIYRESLGPVRIQHANVVTRRAGDDLVDALPRTYQPVSSDWLRGSRPCALLSRHVSVRTPGLGSPCTQDHCRGPHRDATGAPAGHRRGLDCLERTDGRGESRFVPLAPSKRRLLKHDPPRLRSRSLRVSS